jgi:hypothetical protein
VGAAWNAHDVEAVLEHFHDDGPALRRRLVECLFRAVGVVEFAVGIVVQHQHAQRRRDG